jgi:hypothetical protein
VYHSAAPAVRFPYLGTDGEEVCVRYRVSLDGEIKVRTKRGNSNCLYGLNRLPKVREAGFVLLVEGESDTQTLWHAGYPAIGLPGANGWKEERDAEHFEGIGVVYVVVEPDRGGEAVLRWLSRSAIRDRARLVALPDVKDVSELYLAEPDTFSDRLDDVLFDATPWTEHDHEGRELRGRRAWESCQGLAQEPRILDRFLEAVREAGLVGEDRLVKLVYLTVASRLLPLIASLALKGPSAAGKSYVLQEVLRFFREGEDYYAHTGMSERSIIFGEEDLRHKMFVIYEAAGLEEGYQAYIVRSLMSEGRISYPVTEKTPEGRFVTRTVVREGPTGLMVTTTAEQLHSENETRLISMVADDSTEQTQRVLDSLAAMAERGERPQIDYRPWHALQEWLTTQKPSVVVPYATTLASLVPPVAVRLRRDFGAVLTLVEAHALLHRASRELTGTGQVVATIDDYAVVHEVLADLIAEAVESTVSDQTREVVTGVAALVPQHTEGVSLTALSKHLGIDKASVSRRWRVARDGGYLKNLEQQKGRAARLVLDEPLPEEVVILPTSKVLAHHYSVRGNRNTVGAVPGGTTPSPLPPAQVCAEHPDAAVWQAHDHAWYCRICNPPLFPGEVLNERPDR